MEALTAARGIGNGLIDVNSRLRVVKATADCGVLPAFPVSRLTRSTTNRFLLKGDRVGYCDRG